ncbi:MAG: MarR family transcriptional regulator [Aerococcaceae bacterium]|nr:MarR family transcriptional regulator [Aerococcaceae bacterium]
MDYKEATQRLYQVNQQLKRAYHGIDLTIMSRSEFHLLQPLVEQADKPLKASELSQYLHVSNPAVSRTLKSLETKGWITRVDCTNDRRNSYVTLTEQGRQAFEVGRKVCDDILLKALEQLDGDSIERYIEISQQLAQALRVTTSTKEEK